MKSSLGLQAGLIVAMLVGFALPIHASNQALIVNGYLPDEWAPRPERHRGTGNNVWGDPFLMFELLYSQNRHKMPIGQMSASQIHMLWANGSDYDTSKVTSHRYIPIDQLSLPWITDDSASRSTIQSHMTSIADAMTLNDTLFVYFTGHGAAAGTHAFLGVRPIKEIWGGSDSAYVPDSLMDTAFAKRRKWGQILILDKP